MQSLSQSKNQILTWTKRKGRHYELTLGNAVYADMRWDSAFGSRAIGSAAEGQWAIARAGVLHQTITAHQLNRGVDSATLQYCRYGVSSLQLMDGMVYHRSATGQRLREQGFFTAGGELVCGWTLRTNWTHLEAGVRIAPGQEQCRDLSLLVLLGWYCLVMEYDDDTEAAAAACLAVL